MEAACRIRFMFVIALIIAFFIALISLSGCAVLQPIKTALFGATPESPVDTQRPNDRLWHTIKGMTPNWLAIPVIALGAVAVFNGAAKLGFSFIIFGSVNLFMALATSRFGFWMAIIGMIGSFAAVLASMLVKSKALKEVVYGLQKVKDQNIAAIHLDSTKEILSKQTKSTKKLIAKIKHKAKLKGDM